jgi:hypothetical protein
MTPPRPAIAAERCGHRRCCPNVARTYRRLAEEDERAGLRLQEVGMLRPAMTHFCQAIEKYTRYVLCTKVDPTSPAYRERSRHHADDGFLQELLDWLPAEEPVRTELLAMLQEHVLGHIRFHHLHNDLRYPAFSVKAEAYTLLEVTEQDARQLYRRLCLVKKFLHDYERLASGAEPLSSPAGSPPAPSLAPRPAPHPEMNP